MKTLLRHVPILIISLTISACATTPPPTDLTWKTIPEVSTPEDQAWNILVDTVSHYFTDFEVNDSRAGYLKSAWKTTDRCQAGLLFGGMVPCKRIRVIAKIQGRTPFRITMAVERQKASALTNYKTWSAAGNDEEMEKEIMDHLVLKVPSKGKTPVVPKQEKKPSLQIAQHPAIRPSQPGYEEAKSVPSARGVNWAVVIGVSNYLDSKIPSLRYASNDANSFYQWLIAPDGGRYASSRVKLLIDKDATGVYMKKALFEWLKQALEEDAVTIYFAGHGSPESPDSPENLFLLPYDAEYDSIATTGFPMWDIETALKRFIRAQKVVVIADACHAAGVGQSFDIARRASRGITVNPISSGLQSLSQVGDGICVISASDAKQLSQESRNWGGGHGVFTYFLLQGLKGEADYNKDGRVTLGELIPYLSEQVRRATKNAQSPTVAGKFDPALSIGR
jgi:hypothetical protein